MKKLIALVLSIAMLLTCSSALGEDLRFSYWRLNSEPQGTIMNEIVDDFTQETGITVELDATSHTKILEQFTIQSIGDEAADIVVLPFQNLATFVNMGFVIPLTDYITQDPEFYDGFYNYLHGLMSVDNTVYAVSADIASVALYYNKTLAAEAGLDPETPPTNYEEFIQWATAISALGDNIYGFGLGATTEASNQSRWECMMWASGTQMFSDDGTEVMLDSEEGLSAFERIIGMHTTTGLTVENPVELNYNTMMSLFENGQLGMMLQNIGAAATIDNVNPDLEYGITALQWETYGDTLEGAVMFISSSCQKPDFAWELIKYLGSYDNSMRWAIPLNHLSPLTAAEQNTEYMGNPIIKTYIEDILPNARMFVAPANNASVWEAFFGQVSEALNGKDARQAALDAAAAMRQAMIID